MFVPTEKPDVSQISLTGTRSLALIGLLIIAPRTFSEIRESFINMGILEEKASDDILRIDLNTIRSMGCDVSRPCSSNGYKYEMIKHPFSLKLLEDEVKIIKKAYMRVKDNATLEVLLGYDDLFRKLARNIEDEKIKEELFGISVLKYYNINEIKEFYSDCEKHKKLQLIYQNPISKKEILKNIKAQRFVYRNGKLYLYGYDLDKQDSTMLHYKRIKTILSRTRDENNTLTKEVIVTYKLKNVALDEIDENETVIETNKKEHIIKGTFHNDFLAMQKILSYGSKCVVTEPLWFKEKIISRLKEMREVYNG